jgi:hypothetical protein
MFLVGGLAAGCEVTLPKRAHEYSVVAITELVSILYAKWLIHAI